ncbi:hypothetical protein CsatB_001200 [Cannabis sativa]
MMIKLCWLAWRLFVKSMSPNPIQMLLVKSQLPFILMKKLRTLSLIHFCWIRGSVLRP